MNFLWYINARKKGNKDINEIKEPKDINWLKDKKESG
jgi:hypothetical protein